MLTRLRSGGGRSPPLLRSRGGCGRGRSVPLPVVVLLDEVGVHADAVAEGEADDVAVVGLALGQGPAGGEGKQAWRKRKNFGI